MLLHLPGCKNAGDEGMQSNDVNMAGRGRSDRTGGDDLFIMEQELLARVRDVAQQITERVQKALGDTDTHAAFPTKETRPLE